ncbi:MAG: hypothetical protein K6G65_00535 [Lachnospiraceae bacterium]|nr:hypothetical protein [Lachnospiraceae bacterium]
MKKFKIIIITMLLLLPMYAVLPIAYGAEACEYVSEIKVVTGSSKEDALRKLQDVGYTPILKNLAEEKPELDSDYVYAGYKTTTDPAASIEGRSATSTGSVFGDSALMIGGIAMVIGVVIGMISMWVRPGTKETITETENHENRK